MNGGTSKRGLESFVWRSKIQRPAKFALVGAIGIVVQLATLRELTVLGLDYLWATGLAVEAAVLHNFMWHERFTWSDRGASHLAETGVRLLRFHLSNGAISILGSLLLMRWLVGHFGMSMLVANLLAIAACSVGNFLASDRWVFLLPVHVAPKGSHTESAGCGRSPIRSSVRCAKGT
ncbi:MAG TPA: GtrA family protein [Terriglobales bacterium]|jgi:dolichol-phosphate mannosyltransferase|nr:GtrA family protein [Terriglobales bacterium]